MDSKEIRNRSAEIAKSAKSLGKDIHDHLMVIAKHVAAHRDTSLATHFLILLQNNQRDEKHSIVRDDAVKNWLEAFGFCKWSKDKSGKPAFKLNATALDSADADHFRNAARNPWNKFTPAKPYTIFDFDKAVAALIKRAEEKEFEVGPNGERHKVDHAKLNSLREYAKDNGFL